MLSADLYPALVGTPVGLESQNLVSDLIQSLPIGLNARFCRCLWLKDDDPVSCATACRSLLETIIGDVCLREQLTQNRRGVRLYVLVGMCMDSSAVPQTIVDHMLTVRNYGNTGAHAGDDYSLISTAYVEPCVLALVNILKWYMEKYL